MKLNITHLLVIFFIFTLLLLSSCSLNRNIVINTLNNANISNETINSVINETINIMNNTIQNITSELEKINISTEISDKIIELAPEENPDCYFEITAPKGSIKLNENYQFDFNAQDYVLRFSVNDLGTKFAHSDKILPTYYNDYFELMDDIYFQIMNYDNYIRMGSKTVYNNITFRIFNSSKTECKLNKKLENIVFINLKELYDSQTRDLVDACYFKEPEPELVSYYDLINIGVHIQPTLNTEIKNVQISIDGSKNINSFEYQNTWTFSIPKQSLPKESTILVNYEDQYGNKYDFSRTIHKIKHNQEIVTKKNIITISNTNYNVMFNEDYGDNIELKVKSRYFNISKNSCLNYKDLNNNFKFELCHRDIVNEDKIPYYLFEVTKIADEYLENINYYENDYSCGDIETLSKDETFKCEGIDYTYIENYPALNMIQFNTNVEPYLPFLINNEHSSLIINNLDISSEEIEVMCCEIIHG